MIAANDSVIAATDSVIASNDSVIASTDSLITTAMHREQPAAAELAASEQARKLSTLDALAGKISPQNGADTDSPKTR